MTTQLDMKTKVEDRNKIQAQKRMEKFKSKYLKLLAEFPEVTLSGDMNGHIQANSYFGSFAGHYVYTTLPSYVMPTTTK